MDSGVPLQPGSAGARRRSAVWVQTTNECSASSSPKRSAVGICGEPAKPGDPLTADQVVSRAAGGGNTRSNYRAAHRSCNSSRGAKGVF